MGPCSWSISFPSPRVSGVMQGTISQPNTHVEMERLSCQSLLPFENPSCFLIIQIYTQDLEVSRANRKNLLLKEARRIRRTGAEHL